jgi:acyl-CoA thioesterase I
MGPCEGPRWGSGPRSYGVLGRLVQRLAAAAVAVSAVLGPAVGASEASERPVKIVALGDSLTAGYQLPAGEAFPAKLERALKAEGLAVEIANAGVSGDTSTAGLARLDWSVPDGTDAVILELGANDALRGVDPKVTRAALDEIIGRLKARGIAILLCGMLAPPNLGPEFAAAFNTIYPELAAKHDVTLYPFFLDGIVADARLNQGDGIHPTAAGVDVIVSRILPTVAAMVAWVRVKRGS